ncbi:MAG: hypothetical protein II712_03320 [Erysipelotrichaceae bacterium]|nr:hypothetical protein [Erysipelotrichaceae bacterium]
MVDEAYFEKEFWVIDFLPERVPYDSQGRFFDVEALYLMGENYEMMRRKFADIVLRLYCYYDIEMYENEDEEGTLNPDPMQLQWTVMSNNYELCLLFGQGEGLLTIGIDDTHMTLYAPSEKLLSIAGRIAEAQGMFIWQPENDDER